MVLLRDFLFFYQILLLAKLIQKFLYLYSVFNTLKSANTIVKLDQQKYKWNQLYWLLKTACP